MDDLIAQLQRQLAELTERVRELEAWRERAEDAEREHLERE